MSRPLEESQRGSSAPGQRRETPLVFVSSTYLDNANRRQQVIDAINRAGMMAVAMEHWTAEASKTSVASLAKVQEADLFLGIVAWRYGWIPAGEQKSITELEYEAAAGLDRLMFVIDENVVNVNPRRDFDPEPDSLEKQKLLKAFKERIAREQMPAPFTNDNLAVKVLQALTQWRDRQPPPQPPEALEQALGKYLDCIETEHGSLSLAGFETRVRVPLQLDDLYVPLHAWVDCRPTGKGDFATGEEAAEKLDRSGAHQELSLVEAFQHRKEWRHRRGFVILGDPGSGKTTQLRCLALQAARDPKVLDLPDGMVPAYLPLRTLLPEDQSFDGFVERQLAAPELGLGKENARRLLERGELLLLLDGLDEVPAERRVEINGWIETAARQRRKDWLAVTCRYAGYPEKLQLGASFLQMHLRPLNDQQVESFVQKWFRIVETAFAKDPRQAEVKARQGAEELLAKLREPTFRASRVYAMTRNPLLLTAICLVQRDRGHLPEKCAELYAECINVLLEKWREAKKLPVSFEAAKSRQVLQAWAYWLHEKGQTRGAAREIVPVLAPVLRAVGWEKITPESFLATIRDESGLLTGWSGDSFGFMHLGFQEYLAALHARERIFEQAGDSEAFQREIRALAERFGHTWWQEVLLLLLAADGPSLFAPLFREVTRLPAFGAKENSELIGECLQDTLRFDPAPFVELLQGAQDGPENTRARLRQAARILQKRAPEELAKLRSKLSKIRDRELQDLLAEQPAAGRNLILSPRGGIELVKIPGGRFLMGSPETEKGRSSREGPQHPVVVPAFFLSVYPVTNEQYERFLKENPQAKEPHYWGDRKFNLPKQPVVGVSWDEAQAFCRWAGVQLPTEAQWEYACRADSQTRYWFGDDLEEKDLERYAWYEKNSGSLTHPVGEKPPNSFGLYDMHGNVWEWCQDEWSENYEESAKVHPEAYRPGRGPQRVVRGGSAWGNARFLRSAFRLRLHAGYRLFLIGFRVVLPAAP